MFAQKKGFFNPWTASLKMLCSVLCVYADRCFSKEKENSFHQLFKRSLVQPKKGKAARKERNGLMSCYSKCGPQISSISLT